MCVCVPFKSKENMGDTERKKRARRKKKTIKRGWSFPTHVVCSAKDATDADSVQLGLIVSIFIVFLYMFAFYEAVGSLPEPATKRHVGLFNLNLARLEESYVEAATTTTTTTNEIQNNKSNGGSSSIPTATWPVRLQDEANNYETIIHPGDFKTEMSVPPFWSPPLHNKKQFTREQAMKVGTCIVPDPNTGSHVRGDKCPTKDRTIFIAIASYRDFQCRKTVESAFLHAKYPERIRIGVVDQIVDGEDVKCDEPIEPCDTHPEQALCKYKDQVDVYEMPAELSVGPVVARHIGYRLYRGEYYATQSDAHVSFTTDWDEDIISQFESTHNEMAVLSTYLTDVQGSIDPNTGASLRKTRPIMCNTDYEGGAQGMHLRHLSQPERYPSIHGMPQLQPWWAAGYSFSRGHFVVNVPYDFYQPMIFQGEEMSIGIRGFTIGYDYYAPERSVCFHHYAVGKNAKVRNKVKHFWENSNRYAGTGKKAMARLLGIVHMNPEVPTNSWDHTEEDRYGLGKVRTPEKFYELFGIDVKEKTVEHHLCMFVHDGGRMHKMFAPHLRKDGMGINYDEIQFRWVDPKPGRE